jgi:hypothetical protein
MFFRPSILGLTSRGIIFFSQQNFKKLAEKSWKELATHFSTSSNVANCPIVGHITQIGRIKSGAARQIYGRFFADFEQKDRKKGAEFQKGLFSSSYSL